MRALILLPDGAFMRKGGDTPSPIYRGLIMRLSASLGALATATLLAAACQPDVRTAAAEPAAPEAAAAPIPGPGEPTLEEVRALTEKYQDINIALADGYMRDPADMCDTATHTGKPAEWGAMGVHYAHFGQAGVAGPPRPAARSTATARTPISASPPS